MINHQGYIGSVVVDFEDNTLHGKVLFINDLITYEAASPDALQQEFEAAVEDYIDTCKELGKSPDKAFSGSFNVRVEPLLHRRAAIEAKINNISLNEIVKSALEEKLSKSNHFHHHTHNHITELHTFSTETEQRTFSTPAGKSKWIISENASLPH